MALVDNGLRCLLKLGTVVRLCFGDYGGVLKAILDLLLLMDVEWCEDFSCGIEL